MILKLRALKNIGSAFTVTVTSNFRTTCNWPLKLFVKYFENANPFKKKKYWKNSRKSWRKKTFLHGIGPISSIGESFETALFCSDKQMIPFPLLIIITFAVNYFWQILRKQRFYFLTGIKFIRVLHYLKCYFTCALVLWHNLSKSYLRVGFLIFIK